MKGLSKAHLLYEALVRLPYDTGSAAFQAGIQTGLHMYRQARVAAKTGEAQ